MTAQEKTKLLQLIRDGHIRQAIDKLLAVKRNKSLDKEATAIASRYNRLKRKTGSGTLSFEQQTITENQIVDHLINLINYPDDEAYPLEKSIYTTDTTRPVLWKYVFIATLALIILISLAEAFEITNFIPSKGPLELVVHVKDSQNNFVLRNKGTINITLGRRSHSKVIGSDGSARFSEFPFIRKGDTIVIGLGSENWEIADRDTFVFTGDPITLKVKKDRHLGTIKGRVMDRKTLEPIEGAKVMVKDTVVYTDANGFFEIELPEKMWIKNVNDRYDLIVSKPGYKIHQEPHSPKSTDADIRLEK